MIFIDGSLVKNLGPFALNQDHCLWYCAKHRLDNEEPKENNEKKENEKFISHIMPTIGHHGPGTD